MSSIYRIVAQLTWVLGLLALVLAVITKLLHLSLKIRVEPSTLLLAATTLFLCTLATRAIDRS
jgi:hypothetical protein